LLTITRIFQFCAGHRLHRPDWSAEKNSDIFGLCANPAGHGHNYTLEVTVSGKVNPETGMIFNLRELKDLVNEHILIQIDHKNLNIDVPWMQNKIPTTEVFAECLWERLESLISIKITNISLEKIVLHETPRNVVTKTRV
jgi:6-pyruvoyltetrahydropterin/6-carboxytetrahydropterin synthase